jgi:hypothetical protein
MENLSKIAQSIFLGNGEVWNFLDYAINRQCGGLLTYTKKNNYLVNNLFSNLSGEGRERRYSYNDIAAEKGYRLKNGAVEEFSENSGDFIGDVYSVPSEKKVGGPLKFITKENFTNLNEEIRKTNNYSNKGTVFTKNVQPSNSSQEGIRDIGQYNEWGVESYLIHLNNITSASTSTDGEVSFTPHDTIIGKDSFGDVFSFSTPEKSNEYRRKYDIIKVRDRMIDEIKTIRKNTHSDVYYNLDDFKNIKEDAPSHLSDINSTPFGETTLNVKHKKATKRDEDYLTMDTIAEWRYNEAIRMEVLLKEKINSERGIMPAYFKDNKDNSGGYSYKDKTSDNAVHVSGEFVNFITPSTSHLSLLKEGDLYLEKRNINSKVLFSTNTLYPKDGYGNRILWTPFNVYGIEEQNEKYERYSINSKNTLENIKTIDISQVKGQNTLYTSETNERTYTFQQEHEGDNPPTKITKKELSEGSNVLLDTYEGTSKLLERTGQLFRSAKINSLINRFHTSTNDINSELITAFDKNFGLSRGRNLIKDEYEGKQSGDKSTGYDNPYCRVWTAHRQYSKLKHRMRPFIGENEEPIDIKDIQSKYGSLRPDNGANRLSDNTVLRKDGFIRITPTHSDGKFSGMQNYMFSLENLAWKDITTNSGNKSLSAEQKGPNNGRIMWFPPYNLKFSENVNVNWNPNSFIGRGEEMYTYTHTVRTGTLDFTLLVDHPSVLNKWRGMGVITDKDKEKKERDLLRFFAGCGYLNDDMEDKKSKDTSQSTSSIKKDPIPVTRTKKIAYVVFFPNAFSGKDYINRGDIEGAINVIEGYNNGIDSKEKDFSRYKNQDEEISRGLEETFFEDNIDNIKKILFGSLKKDVDELYTINDIMDIDSNFTGDYIYGTLAENCVVKNVELKGFASSHGTVGDNEDLFKKRTNFIKRMLCNQSNYFDENNITFTEIPGHIIEVWDGNDPDKINNTQARIARAAYAIINIDWDDYVTPKNDESVEGKIITQLNEWQKETKTKNNREYVSKTEIVEEDYTYDNEYMYFNELKKDSLVYKYIVDKVRYFDPAFHSITPEGFNARLTFLHQCTRQGPTNSVNSGRVKGDVKDEGGNIIKKGSDDYLKFAGNLAFGRAPYCILRIGDFFNTKICIDSISIQYDNDGIRWDMNTEGIGVQPMYANISISFKFLGGQDISKPIERLQNAVTSNFYANASVYSRHADNENTYYDAYEDKEKGYE